MSKSIDELSLVELFTSIPLANRLQIQGSEIVKKLVLRQHKVTQEKIYQANVSGKNEMNQILADTRFRINNTGLLHIKFTDEVKFTADEMFQFAN